MAGPRPRSSVLAFEQNRQVRTPPPPYQGEGPHALWHVSEEPAIECFVPHRAPTSTRDELLVWAVDTRHLPAFWFPRDCPRGTFWAGTATTPEDAERLLAGARRVQAIQHDWVERFRSTTIYIYRMPEDRFAADREVGGYWISREPCEALEVVKLDDLVRLHVDARIELRFVGDLRALWERVIASSLEFSGMRLRNLAR